MAIFVSLTFLFTIMTNFCKKSVQTLFALATHKTNGKILLETPHRDRNIPPPARYLSFITESPPSSPTTTTTTSVATTDPGGIGFLDDVGGSVGGLMSCTESLGFESSDEWGVDDDDQFQNMNNDELCLKRTVPIVKSTVTKNEVKKKKKLFPPPLSSLDGNGKPKFFLRHVRKDGKLELMEVKINRPEILRASRQDGRLRLHLIRSIEEDVDIEEVLQDEAKEEEDIKEDREGGERGEEWRFPVKNDGSDGIRWCHEVTSHHHHNQYHHNLHAWRQHCMTIR